MMTIKSSIDGDIINAGVDRYRDLNSKHLEPVSSGGEGNLSFLEMVTNQSGVRIATAAKIQVYLNGRPISPPIAHSGMTGVTSAQISVDGIQNTPIGIDKIMSMYTSRDWDSDHPLESAKSLLSADHDFEEIYQESINAWKEIWEKGDIIVKGDRRTQKLLRLSLYHLFITASPHNDQIDAGIPARGLHGEAYRGHIFWDELFILPFINLHFPEITRSALMYRFRRIDRARDYAREFGYQGAMYPWQSGSTGWEETPTIHLNPISKEWGPDNSSLQRHISLAIAYNIWSYYCLTQDMDFLEDYGAEIFFEICRFWASAVSLNEGSSRYEIHRVMGPDEFHEKYPNAEEGGLSNNAYTNIMVLWALSTAREIVDIMEEDKRKEVFNKIHLTEEEWDHWKDIQHKILIPISDLGLLEQFQGFFSLEELNWNQYQKKYSDISRMDRILKNEGKSPDDYQVLKQADVLMSFYLLDEFEVKELLNTAGYSWENRYLEENIHYYLRRTSHGSTLSYLVHAYLCSLIDEDQSAWEFYQQALQSDYIDIQGGTTGEGIHTGVMAGSVYNTLRIYGGLSFKGNQLHLWPNLPDQWQELAFNINFRDQNYAIRITSEDIWIKISGQEPGLTEMKFHGESTYIQNDMWTALPARKEQ
jgi:trehalose/maltose hydrolase-like predicted phosphorylase